MATVGTLPPSSPPVPQPEILLPLTYTSPPKTPKAACFSGPRPKKPILHPGPSNVQKPMMATIEDFRPTPLSSPTEHPQPEILLPLTYTAPSQPAKRRNPHDTYVEMIGSLPPTPPAEEDKDSMIPLAYIPPQPSTPFPRNEILSQIVSPLTSPPSITRHSVSSQSESAYSPSPTSEHSLWELEHEDEKLGEKNGKGMRGLRSPLSTLGMNIEETINFVGDWERGVRVNEDTRRRGLNVLLKGADQDAVRKGWI